MENRRAQRQQIFRANAMIGCALSMVKFLRVLRPSLWLSDFCAWVYCVLLSYFITGPRKKGRAGHHPGRLKGGRQVNTTSNLLAQDTGAQPLLEVDRKGHSHQRKTGGGWESTAKPTKEPSYKGVWVRQCSSTKAHASGSARLTSAEMFLGRSRHGVGCQCVRHLRLPGTSCR